MYTVNNYLRIISMKTQVNPYLFFDGNCKEAMEFYKESLGGELTIMKVSDSPVKEEFSAEKQDFVMHALLKTGDLVIMASDWCMGEGSVVEGNNVTLCLNCETKEEIERFYANLSKGARRTSPLEEKFWGDLYGDLTDKYGFNWMLNCEMKK